jgi:signal transduction histidine kinase
VQVAPLGGRDVRCHDACVSARSVKFLAWGSLFFIAACSVTTIVFAVLAWDVPTRPNEFGPKGFGIAFALTLGGVGAVIAARRPSNPIGWIFCVLGVMSGVMAVGSEYARWALIEEGGQPAGGLYAAWVVEWLWIPLVAGLAVVAGVFPDGRFLSRRWRISILIAAVLAIIPTILWAVIPTLTIFVGHANPIGVGNEGLVDVAESSISLLLLVMLLGTASASVRFRRARGEERQQIKWLLLSMTAVAAMVTLYGIIAFATAGGSNPQDLEWAEYGMIVSFLAVPVSIAFGVLKYRLYDIDFVINKAVVYGALAVFITLIYVGIVVGVGAAIGSQGNAVLSALAAAVVALAFQPARRRAQHLANRVVYGRRATPYEVLSELSSRFAGTYSLEDALPRLARVIAEAVAAERIWIWLRSEGELRPAASWPAADPGDPIRLEADVAVFSGGEAGFPVRHQGELLGAISVLMPSNESLTATQEKLLTDVASQAGLVLRNVALVEDVRASRRRIVAAQDDRAKALERNIHDGAQQQLVALSVKLRLAEQLAETDPAKVGTLLKQLQAETTDALENLRDLARGIYPPLLADKGLGAALEAQARKASVPTSVDSDGIGRYPQEVEAALYFCSLEAFQNVAKYADASRAAVRIREHDGRLEVEIEDDGIGFDAANTPRGAGLQNMSDRLSALGGSVEVESAPGLGTTVRGWVPRAHGDLG